MKLKKLFCLSFLLSATYAYATNEKLTDYKMIKNSVLNGSTIKMVMDLKNHCKVTYDYTNDDGPPTKLNILVSSLTDFSIKVDTNYIMWMSSIMGDGDEKYPGNYQTSVIYISPDNQVNLETKIIALPSYKLLKNTRFLCTIENKTSVGVKFFAV